MKTPHSSAADSNQTASSPANANAPGAVDTKAARLELIAEYQRQGVEAADPFAALRAAMLANVIGVAFERSATVLKTLRGTCCPRDYVDTGIPAVNDHCRVLEKIGTLAALGLRRSRKAKREHTEV